MKHTKEPWRYCTEHDEITTSPIGIVEGSKSICRHLLNQFKPESECVANAHRIIACVNSCAGIKNPAAIPEVVEALKGIRQFGSDTLSGRADGGLDDREWQRDAVIEMTKRARIALAKMEGGEG